MGGVAEYFAQRVKCVAFTDAVHSVSDQAPEPIRVRFFFGSLISQALTRTYVRRV